MSKKKTRHTGYHHPCGIGQMSDMEDEVCGMTDRLCTVFIFVYAAIDQITDNSTLQSSLDTRFQIPDFLLSLLQTPILMSSLAKS